MNTKICYRCKNELKLSQFGKNKTKKDGLQAQCRVCQAEYRKIHYQKNRRKYIERADKLRTTYKKDFLDFLKEQSCKDCGNNDWRVLEFDHKRDKDFNIARKKGQMKLETLMKEINKCDVVCANCHRIRTHLQFNYYSRC